MVGWLGGVGLLVASVQCCCTTAADAMPVHQGSATPALWHRPAPRRHSGTGEQECGSARLKLSSGLLLIEAHKFQAT